ncbi:hypothetical protein L596_009265 [Steinernema carpocapsae]|uniref:Uncharacterized protein n=1 Tax=Steinernema carpocapsae TaxID=34508 RepID=A0A4U5PG22_STECR|nr:hypothetical protein L596_009265 [Steinernema carpocapsae]
MDLQFFDVDTIQELPKHFRLVCRTLGAGPNLKLKEGNSGVGRVALDHAFYGSRLKLAIQKVLTELLFVNFDK